MKISDKQASHDFLLVEVCFIVFTFIILFDIHLSYLELEKCDFDFTKKYSIDELHNYLTKTVTEQTIKNRLINYSAYERFLEVSDVKYSISLPKDTHELIYVGAQMHICVGSYTKRVVNKDCTVLVLRLVGTNSPVGCVELSGETVVQAKGLRNKLLQGHEKNFVEDWATKKGLTVGTKDLQRTTGLLSVIN